MEDRKKIEKPIAKELSRFHTEFADSLRSTTRTPWLDQAIDQILNYSGKHIRPLLVLLTAKTLGEVADKTINSAVMVELLHTSTLIHDDVIDETRQRRGVPSLNAIFDNRVSVLVGDYILSSALIRSTLLGDLRIVGIISSIGQLLAEGEIKQMEAAEESIIDEGWYLDVIRKKTAMLLSACTEIGALSVDATEEYVEKCRLFGEYVGYAFQIRDDIFDYFEDELIGKPTGNDIREGKVTLPLLYALRKEEERGEVYFRNIIINKEFTKDNVASLINFARENKGIEYAEEQMRFYCSKANELLHDLPESEARESLFLLTEYIMQRTK